MKKIVSYSLYNDRPKDTINAIINCLLIPAVYPGWVARFYVDDTIPRDVDRILRSFVHVEVINMPRHAAGEAMLWRFLAAEDADIMISRDADSWVSMREKVCVDAWIESGKAFHVIRDHCYHSQKVMGGMWGVRGGVLGDVRDLAATWTANSAYDQGFLADVIYPRVRESMIVHYGHPQFNFDGQEVRGYFDDGGIPIPEYNDIDEPVAGLSFREANRENAFFCCHCKKTHPTLIGGITTNIPSRAIEVVKQYAASIGETINI